MAVSILLYHEDRYVSEHLRSLLSEDARTYSAFYFTEAEKAAAYYAEHKDRVKCVLASKGFLDALAPSGTAAICTDEETVLEPLPGEAYRVNIFQSRSAVRDDLRAILRAAGLLSALHQKAYETKVISFFSTQGGSGRTTLAYLTALRLADSGKTAFFDLEPSPCMQTLYHAPQGQNPEEFLAAVQDRAAPERLITVLTVNEHGVYVLPEAASLQDRAALEPGDVEYLLRALLDRGELRNLVVVLGSAMGAVEQLVMENSDRIVFPYNDDKMGAAKRACLENDPNYTTYPFVGREFWVGNRCRAEYSDGRYDVCFPVSGSLNMVDDLRAVLTGNPAFRDGCDAIARI